MKPNPFCKYCISFHWNKNMKIFIKIVGSSAAQGSMWPGSNYKYNSEKKRKIGIFRAFMCAAR